jgi:hypothetical protein
LTFIRFELALAKRLTGKSQYNSPRFTMAAYSGGAIRLQDHRFYWSDRQGEFRIHSSDLAPNAKLDGFLVYPPLREGASHFKRWFLADNLIVSGKLIVGEYDVALPKASQLRLLAGGVSDVEDSGPDFEEDGEDKKASDDLEDDSWQYRDEGTSKAEGSVHVIHRTNDPGVVILAGRLADDLLSAGYRVTAEAWESDPVIDVTISIDLGTEELAEHVRRHVRQVMGRSGRKRVHIQRGGDVSGAENANEVWVFLHI